MTEPDEKKRLRQVLKTMPAELAQQIREAIRKHKPELLTDDHVERVD